MDGLARHHAVLLAKKNQSQGSSANVAGLLRAGATLSRTGDQKLYQLLRQNGASKKQAALMAGIVFPVGGVSNAIAGRQRRATPQSRSISTAANGGGRMLANIDTTIVNPAKFTWSQTTHREHGPGMLLHVAQPFCTLATVNLSTIIFSVGSTPATIDATYGTKLHPMKLNGRALGLTQAFSRYRWKSIKLIYIPSAGTDVAGQFSIALMMNWDIGSHVGLTYDDVAQIQPCLAARYCFPAQMVWNNRDDKCYNLDMDETTSAGYVDQVQCSLYGVAMGAASGDTTVGKLWIDCEYEVYYPTSTDAVSPLAYQPLVRKLMRSAYLEGMRGLKWEQREDSITLTFRIIDPDEEEEGGGAAPSAHKGSLILPKSSTPV